jgi:RNA polymerase sigma-70 factor (ECF subfamily)
MRYSKSKAEAEDNLQDGFIRIYKDLHQFNPQKGAFKAWAYRIVINTCLQKIRSRKINYINLDTTGDMQIDVEHNAGIVEELSLQELTELIQGLPDGYRMVFNMYVMDGFSHKEISELLNISESTSKTQLFKAKRTLQQRLIDLYKVEANHYG